MLNELIEYEQYSYDVSVKMPAVSGRLQYGFLCREDKRTGKINFSGLERAMTIVARYFMFNSGKKDAELSRFMLQAWCGTIDLPEEIKDATTYNWLHDYIRYSLLNNKVNELLEKKLKSENGKIYFSEKVWMPDSVFNMLFAVPELEDDAKLLEISKQLQCVDNIGWENTFSTYIKPIICCVLALNTIPEKRKSFGKNIFEQSVVSKGKTTAAQSENDYKTIRYEKILAEASNQGPLKKYYLLLDDKYVLNGVADKPKERDMLLKTISAFLLGKTYENQKFVAVNFTDILNWQNNSKDDDYRKWRDHISFNDEQIFKTEILQNQAKLFILPTFIGHFKLVEETHMRESWDHYKSQNRNAVFYDDRGSAFPLVEMEEYCE